MVNRGLPYHARMKALVCTLRASSRLVQRRRVLAPQHGFTFLGMLFVVLALGFALASVAFVWRTAVQRDRETELLFVGKQYRQAIASYYAAGQREFPARLEDLLADPRFPEVKRHLRRLYRDPMTGKRDWGLVKVGNRIVGVYSLGTDTPLREVPSGSADDPPIGGKSYSEWKFVVDPRTQGQAAVQPGAQGLLPEPGQPGVPGMPGVPGPNGGLPGTGTLPVPMPGTGSVAAPGAGPLPLPGPGVEPVDPGPEMGAIDPCEQEQEAALAACGSQDSAAQDNEIQQCVTEAFQQFQNCKGSR